MSSAIHAYVPLTFGQYDLVLAANYQAFKLTAADSRPSKKVSWQAKVDVKKLM